MMPLSCSRTGFEIAIAIMAGTNVSERTKAAMSAGRRESSGRAQGIHAGDCSIRDKIFHKIAYANLFFIYDSYRYMPNIPYSLLPI
jgi:hypothetical protein